MRHLTRRNAVPQRGVRPRALNGGSPGYQGAPLGGYFAYDAANIQTREMGDWNPLIRSPDTEINLYRDRIVARSRDLVRNDAWADGAIKRILDSTIGGAYRLRANPDYRALAAIDKGFDGIWADEFKIQAEALWRSYADDVDRYCDVSRKLTLSQQFRLALRHRLIDGENLSVTYWMPERVGYGAAKFATTFRVVDPDRLSNPYQMVDTKTLRGGIEIDENGVPLAYHIRKAHQNDWYNAVESMEWDRVLRQDDDGWRRVIHGYETDRADQNRGMSIFASVLPRMKMLARYYGIELQAANVATTLGTYITTPYDPQQVEQAIENSDGQNGLAFYQAFREGYSETNPAMLDGVRIPVLAPGESIETVAAAHPHEEFSPFAHEMLRSLSAVTGLSAEQITQDYSEVNYSSARAAIVEAEKTFVRRLHEFNADTATPHYAAWLHEAIDLGMLPMPHNAPAFVEHKTALSRCSWLGPGRGWVDPVAERQGAVLGLDACFSTLEEECAKQGLDYEEVLDQRQRELRAMDERNLPRAEWMGPVPATLASRPQEKPEAA